MWSVWFGLYGFHCCMVVKHGLSSSIATTLKGWISFTSAVQSVDLMTHREVLCHATLLIIEDLLMQMHLR